MALAGIDRLWSHQAEVLEHARAARHTVVATGTASGKSLAYLLPVIERILVDDTATALYLTPTKALAHDQLRALRGLKLAQVRAAVIDGDTPHAERDAIRRTANLVLTNPDLVHHAMLGDHKRWAEFLHRLSFVIVDEAHVARGVFGGHVALVLRRLRRIAERYGAEPTWLFATATIGNPAEHASRLAGVEVVAVTDDGAPRGELTLGLWDPPTDEDADTPRSVIAETGQLLTSFVAAGVQTLVFARSRKLTELITRDAQHRLADMRDHDGRLLAEQVAAYRAGYLATDRRQLEDALRSGALRGVVATQALELGIDVSGLDAVVLAGWPGTTASFWQRVGRAGRTGGAAVAVLVAQNDPLDQYLVSHPDTLLTREPEDAIIDPSNPHLLAGHLRCACHEAPMDRDEAERWFGASARDLLADAVDTGQLRERAGRFHWVSRTRPAAGVDLRGAGGRTVQIVDDTTGEVIGDVDEARAHHQVHAGAVYHHRSRQYVVEQLDLERALAMVREDRSLGYTTRPRSDTDVRITEVVDQRDGDPVAVRLARVRVTRQVTAYDVLRAGTGQVIEQVALALPEVTLDTVAVLYTVTSQGLDAAGIGPRRLPGALHAAEHASIAMLPLIALCDRWDLGGLSTPSHPDTGLPTVFIYDGHPGGAGLTERSFLRFAAHQRLTRDTVASCRCADGCLACVHSPKCGNGNEPLDKRAALDLLTVVLAHAPDPA